MKPDVILGGGVAGLAAAGLLCQRGSQPVTLLERNPYLGGLASTLDWEGCRIDLGPHRIYTVLPGIERYILDILGSDVLRVHRKSSMFLRGRFIQYPVSFKEVISSLGAFCAFRIGTSYAWSLATSWSNRSSQSQSYADYMRTRFGSYLYQLLFRDYAQKVWQEEPQNLSSHMAEIRLATPDLLTSLKEALRPTGRGIVKEFLYPKGGIGKLSSRMGDEVITQGGKILREWKVQSLVMQGKKVKSILGIHPQGTFEIEPERVISTLPLPILLKAFNPPPPQEIQNAVEALPFASMILVYLLADKPQVRPDCWLYFPDRDLIFTRIYEVNNFDRSNVPPGQSCLCVEVPCRDGDSVWSLSDREIENQVKQGLEKAGLGIPASWSKSLVLRLKDVYPVYQMGYEESLGQVISYLSTVQNLISTGRGGFFCYNNLDHSIDMGLLAAEYFLSEHAEGNNTEKFYRLRPRFEKYRIVD